VIVPGVLRFVIARMPRQTDLGDQRCLSRRSRLAAYQLGAVRALRSVDASRNNIRTEDQGDWWRTA
jgi:hypothetical protein